MARGRGPDASYWAEYSPHQRAKHELVRRYLGGWFAKLGTWAGRVLYVDTHAGRGRHASGDVGSPLVALNVLLEHRSLNRLVEKSEFQFHFIERDEENLASLRREIAQLPTLPRNVSVVPHLGDCFPLLSRLLAELRTAKQPLAPAFVFVDPYGFSIPGRILKELMAAGRVELFINIMWREIDMAIAQSREGGPLTETLDSLFGADDWRARITAGEFEERIDQAVELLTERIGAKWATYIRMVGTNRATRYVLLHLSNHDQGRDLMKEAMWSVAPDGAWVVRKSDAVGQQYLLTPRPDLTPLRAWVRERLDARPMRWSELEELIRPLPWRDKHLSEVVRELRRSGVIAAIGSSTRFSRKANPVLCRNKEETR